MTKRKYEESESEDAKDRDNQDDQASDDDYVPTSNEGEQERRSMPTRRATQPRSRQPAPTTAAPQQDVAKVPKVSILPNYLSSKALSNFRFKYTNLSHRSRAMTPVLQRESPHEYANVARLSTVESSRYASRTQ